jgi:hypothetical protein
MPESTSSNTSVPTGDSFAATSWIARLMRDSSPPEATFASGRSGRLGCDATSNADFLGRRAPGRSSGRRSARSAAAIARLCIACVTSRPSACAALLRFADSFFAAAS